VHILARYSIVVKGYFAYAPGMISWLRRLAKNPLGIGAIAPSSPFLAKLMTKEIKNDFQVLELGPGSGAFTGAILKCLNSPSQLVLIEQDSGMAKKCRKRFPEIQLHETDAALFLAKDDQLYDTIVSGIPFAAIPKTKRNAMFAQIANHLKPNGHFVMFQYSLTTRKELDTHFAEVKTNFTPLNLPPAFVFVGKGK